MKRTKAEEAELLRLIAEQASDDTPYLAPEPGLIGPRLADMVVAQMVDVYQLVALMGLEVEDIIDRFPNELWDMRATFGWGAASEDE